MNTIFFRAVCTYVLILLLMLPPASALGNTVEIGAKGNVDGDVYGQIWLLGLIWLSPNNNTVKRDDKAGNAVHTVFGNVYGSASRRAFSESSDRDVTGNTVNFDRFGTDDYQQTSGSEGSVYGGYADGSGVVSGNKVSIYSGGTINGSVYGGKSYPENGSTGGEVSSNEVSIYNSVLVYGAAEGGYGRDGSVSGNKVSLSASTVLDDIYGGAGYYGVVSGNSVVMDNKSYNGWISRAYGNIYGGHASNNDARGNSVTISGGMVHTQNHRGNVYGGYASTGSATGNSVTISGGTVEGGIYGGYGNSSGSATNNTVSVSGGTVGDIYGGYGYNNNATGNTVSVSGGTAGSIYGGYSAKGGSGSATGNAVSVVGGTVGGDVYGGYSVNNDATGNTVTLQYGTFQNVYGGYSNTAGKDAATGNILNMSPSITVNSATNFSYINLGYNGDVGIRALDISGGVTVDTKGYDVTFSGSISGAGDLAIAGGGMTLSGNNSYSGDTTFTEGESLVTGTLGGGNYAGNIHIGGYSLEFNQSGAQTLSGIISGSSDSNKGELIKNGGGTLTLTGENTYTGLTSVYGGTLQIGDGGTSGKIASNSLSLGKNTSVAFNRSDDYTHGGNILDSGSLIKLGAGTLTLGGANTYTGGTTVSAGTLAGTTSSLQGNIANNAVLQFNQAGDGSYTGNISGSGALTKLGTGVVELEGSASQGSVDIQAGALALASGYSLTATGDIRVAAGAALSVFADDPAIAKVYAGTVTAENGAILNINGYTEDTRLLKVIETTNGIAGDFDLYVGGAKSATGLDQFISVNDYINSDGKNLYVRMGLVWNQDKSTAHGHFNIAANNNFFLLAPLRDNQDGAGGTHNWDGASLTKTGDGTLTLLGKNTYSGGTTISKGLINFINAGSFGTGQITLDGGGLQWARGNTTDISNKFAPLGAGGGTFDTNGNNVTLSGVISGAGGLTKAGKGILSLTGANTYQGGTTISRGLISFINGGNFGAGQITLDGGGLQWASGNTTDISGKLEPLGAGGGTFDTNDNNVTLAGAITGGGGLTKTGEGTLTLTGTNTYSGGTTVSAGILSIASDVNIGGGTNTLAGGTLRLTGNNIAYGKDWTLSAGSIAVETAVSATMSGVLTGTGPLTKTGAGTLTLTGTNTYSGGTTVSAGALSIASDANIGGGTNTLAGGTLRLTGNNIVYGKDWTLSAGSIAVETAVSATISGVLAGTGPLTKTGAGTLTLTGSNTYSGLTTVSAGTLRIGDGGTSGGITGDIVNQSQVAFNRSDDHVYGGNISGSGSLTKLGAGTLTLTGTNTYEGGTTVNAGTLSIGSDANIGGGTNTLAGGAALQLTGNAAYSSDWTLNAGSAIATVGNTAIMSGVLAGTGPLTKTGAGTLTLTGDSNTYTGGTTVSEGTLQIGDGGASGGITGDILNNARVAFNRSDNYVYGGVISGTGGLAKDGAGTLTLTNDNTYGGGTMVSAGTLNITGSLGGGTYAGDVGISSDATLLFNQNGAQAQTLSGEISGSGVLGKQGVNTLTLNGDITLYDDEGTSGITVGGGTLQIGGNDTIANIVNRARLEFTHANGMTGTYTGDVAGAGALVKTGAGTTELRGNVRQGSVDIQAGALALTPGYTLTATDDIAVAGWAALSLFADPAAGPMVRARTVTADFGNNSILNINGYTADLDREVVITTTDGITNDFKLYVGGQEHHTIAVDPLQQFVSANLYRVNGGKDLAIDIGLVWYQTSASAHGDFYVHDGNFFLLAPLRDNPSGADGTYLWDGKSLTKTGAGTLTLLGKNTYSGDTTVTAGTLSIGSDDNIGSGKNILQDGTLQLTDSAYSKDWTLAHANSAIETRGNIAIMRGALSGPGGLTKTGAGILTLAGANTYQGGTTVDRGWLAIAGSLGNGSGNNYAYGGDIDINSGASLIFGQSVNQALSGDISGAGSLVKSGVGVLTLTGGNTYSGGTKVIGGTLSGNTASLQGDIVNDANVVFNQADNGTYAGMMSGSGTLTKLGAGILTLKGNNIYTGFTDVLQGTLALDAGAGISDKLRLHQNTVFDSGGNDIRLFRLGVLGNAEYRGDLDVSGPGSHMNFFLPDPGAPALRVYGTAYINGVTVGLDVISKLRMAVLPSHTMTLIESDGLSGAPANSKISGHLGLTRAWTARLTWDANNLYAAITDVRASPEAKALSEGFIAGLALVTEGANTVAGIGMSNAVAAAKGVGVGGRPALAGFGALSGGFMRYNTGSHVDMSSVSLVAGLAWGTDLTPGRLTLGAFFEYGNGSYDTYNSFSNAASVHGDGNVYYIGGGILGRMDFAETGPGHFYMEGSFRAGGVHNEYSNSDLRDAVGRKADYDADSAYYGFHAGSGYVWNITEKASLDVYGKYFWTRQEGDSVTLDTDERVKFKDADSSRLRGGARFAYSVNEYVSPYIGAAYEYEFDGKARATTDGLGIDEPSLRGGTGVGELGFTLKPSTTLPLSLDLGVQGYTGKREGVTGSLQFRLEF